MLQNYIFLCYMYHFFLYFSKKLNFNEIYIINIVMRVVAMFFFTK